MLFVVFAAIPAGCLAHPHAGSAAFCFLHRNQTLDSTDCTRRSRCSRNQSVCGPENCSDGGCRCAAFV